jgi:exopolysaccharide biosynthesis polyprenyl glycosylphosphotransferase
VVEVINAAPSGHLNGGSNGSKGRGDVLERVQALVERRTIDEVFLALSLDGSQPLLTSVIALCEEQGITLRVVANLAVLDWGRASIDTLGGQPVLTISSGPPDTVGLLVKRALDLVGTAVGLVVLAPLFALIALAIRIDSKGPVVFSQERVGYNRRRFKAYKFRTMVVGAESMQASLEHMNEAVGPVFKIKNDPRVTRVGRWLRRLSLDELPQLFNVLLGDMSLVGPRPLPVRDVSRMDVRWHRRRFSVKPGITCLWQVNSRTPNFDEWIRSDMEYIDNWSLSLDLKILAKTLPAVWSGQGAH